MNEKIKELAKQAGLTLSMDQQVAFQRAAELIVKDVRWVMQTAADDFILDKNYNAVKGVGRCMRRVKQHFGVEE